MTILTHTLNHTLVCPRRKGTDTIKHIGICQNCQTILSDWIYLQITGATVTRKVIIQLCNSKGHEMKRRQSSEPRQVLMATDTMLFAYNLYTLRTRLLRGSLGTCSGHRY